MASRRALPGSVSHISVLCIITMGKRRLFYVPYHVSGFLRERERMRERENVFTVFLLVSD